MHVVPPPTPTTSSKSKGDNHVLFAVLPPLSPGATTEQIINHRLLYLQQPSDVLGKEQTNKQTKQTPPLLLPVSAKYPFVYMGMCTHMFTYTQHTHRGASAHFLPS